jgi:hypothetical protein
MITSLLYLPYLGESVDEADIPVMLVAGHVEGQHVSMGSLCCNFQTSSTRRPQEQACERAVLLGPTLRQAVMLRKTARA